MSEKKSPTIHYRFEKCPKAVHGFFNAFAETAQHLLMNNPLLVPSLPFGKAARVSSGLLYTGQEESLSGTTSPFGAEPVRLKAIESSEDTLLEHSYDINGHLVETVYSDGGCNRYHWNDTDQLVVVFVPGGGKITFEYCKNGRIKTITYPGNQEFSYEYDDGKLLKYIYPDKKCVEYNYNIQGHLIEISYADIKFIYDWDENGSLKHIVSNRHGETHELYGGKDKVNVAFNLNQHSGICQQEIMSALGLWEYSPNGHLQGMMLPDGQRLCFLHDSAKNIDLQWNPQGQINYEYYPDGALKAVLASGGARTFFHRIIGTNDVWAVSGNGVTLYQYNSKGRLYQIRNDTGQYVKFEYDINGMIAKAATDSGIIQLKHDGMKRLVKFKLSNGLSGKFYYKIPPYPISAVLWGIEPDVLVYSSVCSTIMWQWTTLTSALRLNDPTFREA